MRISDWSSDVCSSDLVMRFGGNTSSLEIRCGSHLLLFDAGTGLRALGMALQKQGRVDADLFLTHTHYDHVCGLPHFCAAFDPRNSFRIHAGHVTDGMGIKGVLKPMMCSPQLGRAAGRERGLT